LKILAQKQEEAGDDWCGPLLQKGNEVARTASRISAGRSWARGYCCEPVTHMNKASLGHREATFPRWDAGQVVRIMQQPEKRLI